MWEIFEELLKRDGVSIADVSKATGINQSVFSNWKKRNSRLSAQNAEKIAKYFGVTVGFLMGVKEDSQETSYYNDPMAALTAQQMFDDRRLRALNHVANKVKFDKFDEWFRMLIYMYRTDHPEDDYDFENGKPTE